MTGKEIIASVLKQTGVSAADFFGNRRARQLTAARVMAILELTKLGLSASAIGRIVRRNHVTVLYWQRPEMREQRRAHYATQYVPRPRQEREPKLARVRKPRKKLRKPIEPNQCFYTAAEDVIARQLFTRGAGSAECIRVLGRDRDSVRKRIMRLDNPEFLERCRQRDRDRQIKRREQAQAGLPLKHVTSAQIDDARARAVAPRSLTAWSFGDPPPGHSALDRRNASEARVS